MLLALIVTIALIRVTRQNLAGAQPAAVTVGRGLARC
jgi:hypothetical protein